MIEIVPEDTSFRKSCTGEWGLLMVLAKITNGDDPIDGARQVSSAYNVAPRPKTSAALPAFLAAQICSGAMKPAVPSATFVLVSPSRAASCRAMPRSAILAELKRKFF